METKTINNDRWIVEQCSGHLGYRCTVCATWVYTYSKLECECTKKAKRKAGILIALNPNHEHTRENIANHISECFNLNFYNNHVSYKPNKHDDSYWTLDESNNWKLKFHDNNTLEIRHRYNNKDAIRTISAWIAYRMGGLLQEEL